MRYNLPRHVLWSLYSTLIHLYFEYCNIGWAINKSSVLDNLFCLSKKVVRLITFSSYKCHSLPLHKACNFMPRQLINDSQPACFMYPYVNNIMPVDLCKIFAVNSGGLPARPTGRELFGGPFWTVKLKNIMPLTISCLSRVCIIISVFSVLQLLQLIAEQSCLIVWSADSATEKLKLNLKTLSVTRWSAQHDACKASVVGYKEIQKHYQSCPLTIVRRQAHDTKRLA